MKSFESWNELKQKTQGLMRRLFFHEREIWFVRCGQNVGCEQNGKGPYFLRPVLICKKFNHQVFWGVPLTSGFKTGPFYFNIPDSGGKKASAILSQLRLFDAKRLQYKIGNIEVSLFLKLKKTLKSLFD